MKRSRMKNAEYKRMLEEYALKAKNVEQSVMIDHFALGDLNDSKAYRSTVERSVMIDHFALGDLNDSKAYKRSPRLTNEVWGGHVRRGQ